jgi:hypothetical protein
MLTQQQRQGKQHAQRLSARHKLNNQQKVESSNSHPVYMAALDDALPPLHLKCIAEDW